MKKLMSMLIAVICMVSVICCAAAENSSGAWPIRQMGGTAVRLNTLDDSEARHQSFFGPAAQYPGAGAYKPGRVTDAIALFREGDYVLVDLSYRTVGRRCVYFRTSSLSKGTVEEEKMKAYPAQILESVQPKFGPGAVYDDVEQTVRNPWTGVASRYPVELRAGCDVSVFFETDGWVYAEFSCVIGLIRAWIPVECITVG